MTFYENLKYNIIMVLTEYQDDKDAITRSCLLVDPAARGSVVDEDADDAHVSPPGCQVQWEASLVVGHICGRLKLQQL